MELKYADSVHKVLGRGAETEESMQMFNAAPVTTVAIPSYAPATVTYSTPSATVTSATAVSVPFATAPLDTAPLPSAPLTNVPFGVSSTTARSAGGFTSTITSRTSAPAPATVTSRLTESPPPEQGPSIQPLEMPSPGRSSGRPLDFKRGTGGSIMNQVLEGGLAERVYELASRKIDDVEFHITILSIATKFDFTDNIQTKVIRVLLNRYPFQERTWDTLAKRELAGLRYSLEAIYGPNGKPDFESDDDDDDSDSSSQSSEEYRMMKTRIRRCCAAYEFACRKTNTERMWSMYLDVLKQIFDGAKRRAMREYVRALLGKAYEACHKALLMGEKYYNVWAAFEYTGKPKVGEILANATDRYSLSSPLWEKRMLYHLQLNEEVELTTVYKEALRVLGAENLATLPLRYYIILYWQLTSPPRVAEFFEDGALLDSDVSNDLKPRYLDWLINSRGIQATRDTYLRLCTKTPFCLQFHQKMISLEAMQLPEDVGRIRNCHILACNQFGKKNPDVWMDFVKFELERGNTQKVREIRTMALESLDSFLAENWLQELCVVANCMVPVGEVEEGDNAAKEEDQSMDMEEDS